jgi:hypothetical protein
MTPSRTPTQTPTSTLAVSPTTTPTTTPASTKSPTPTPTNTLTPTTTPQCVCYFLENPDPNLTYNYSYQDCFGNFIGPIALPPSSTTNICAKSGQVTADPGITVIATSGCIYNASLGQWDCPP